MFPLLGFTGTLPEGFITIYLSSISETSIMLVYLETNKRSNDEKIEYRMLIEMYC